MSHKIEQIYDYSVSQIISGAAVIDISLFTSEYFWTAFNQKQKPFVQYLSNFLYSLSKLVPNKLNQDLIFYEKLLLSASSGKRILLLFLLFRQIFQKVLDKGIVKGNTLRIDPNCTDIDRDLVKEIITNLAKICHDAPQKVIDRILERCMAPKIEYYKLIEFILDESELLSGDKEELWREAITYFTQNMGIIEEEGVGTDDMMDDKSAHRLESYHERPLGSHLTHSPQETHSMTGLRNSDQKSQHPDYQSYVMNNDGNDRTNRSKADADFNRSSPQHGAKPEELYEGVPESIMELISNYLNIQENTNLERRVRASLANLVCKFVEIVVKEHQPPDVVGAIAKIDQVVIRKTQNLLTCLFRENKVEFQEILRLKAHEAEDNSRIEILFSTYLLLKRMPNPPDSEIESLTKRVLKVSKIS
jgi:hypothetical protein